MSRRLLLASVPVALLAMASPSFGQSAGAIYTWDGAANVEDWAKNFGTNTVTLDNAIPGTLTITETGGAGSTVAITDGGNRVRESSTAASGGTDLTGLTFLEFDIGHNGTADVPVQFFIQGSTGFNFVALGPDVAVSPGVHTYQLPLAGLTPEQKVYIRTMGINIRDHAAQGNLTWTLNEVRSSGQTLSQRTLVSFDNGTAEGGLQGALVNFDGGSVQGNSGQNQTGLSQNPSGSGSLQWTDIAGGAGGAVSWGNGTALNGNTFNNRTTDVSNYTTVTYRMSATDPAAGGGTVDVQGFFQRNGFTFAPVGTLALPIDGQFHDLTFNITGISDLNVVEQTGVNLATHPQTLTINIDSVTFAVPEPASATVLGMTALGFLGRRRRTR